MVGLIHARIQCRSDLFRDVDGFLLSRLAARVGLSLGKGKYLCRVVF